MSDEVAGLARAAGVAPRWKDYRETWHDVSPDSLLAVLDALELPGRTAAQLASSHATLAERNARPAPLMTGVVGEPIIGPLHGRYQITLEHGGVQDGVAAGSVGPVQDAGYHTLELGGVVSTLAVAPRRGFTVADAAPGTRPWALAVQLYSLRRAGDGGIGDFLALQDLVGPAARMGAAGIAISPVHAQFSADVNRYSPYSPSSRIGLNVLHAGLGIPPSTEARRLESLDLLDWPAASRLRLDALRSAFHAASPETLTELAAYRAAEGSALQTHAVFEALHAHQFGSDPALWHWRSWSAALQDPNSPAVQDFAAQHAEAVTLHAYMQFITDRSLADTQAAARAAGMPIGLIADLAVGADSGGSHCWSRQHETLLGLTIGAPPDLLSAGGQSWGLAAFSPRGLMDRGYRAFIEMLRHAMRHAGGVRIDHALGLARLWVVPDGASAADGAYLTFPLDDMLRLIALESVRNRTIVMGEDLGTIPEGFQDRLREAGTLGMRVLWFEKFFGQFLDPRGWTPEAAAMTSTHDLPTVAGWWSGRDLTWRRSMNLAGGAEAEAREAAEREADRAALWSAFEHSGAATGPAPDIAATAGVVDAAVRHLATASCELVILPIEDALGLAEQPNLPGTTDTHPNWRRRLPGQAATLLDDPAVTARLDMLTEGRRTA